MGYEYFGPSQRNHASLSNRPTDQHKGNVTFGENAGIYGEWGKPDKIEGTLSTLPLVFGSGVAVVYMNSRQKGHRKMMMAIVIDTCFAVVRKVQDALYRQRPTCIPDEKVGDYEKMNIAY